MTTIIARLFRKTIDVFYRIGDFIRLLPIRLYRLGRHVWYGLQYFRKNRTHWKRNTWKKHAFPSFSFWWIDFFFYFIDCLGVGEWYEIVLDFTKFNTRPLQPWEKEMAQSVFGDSINYQRVRIDEAALAGPKQQQIAYVSCYTINSWGPMQNSLLIHELTHVWQYEQVGAVYIPRALRAQFTQQGYNYGGVKILKAYLKRQKSFLDFNFEQQGDIVADYFRIRDGYQPRWGKGNKQDLEVYEQYINQLQS